MNRRFRHFEFSHLDSREGLTQDGVRVGSILEPQKDLVAVVGDTLNARNVSEKGTVSIKTDGDPEFYDYVVITGDVQ